MTTPYWIDTCTKHYADACKLGDFLEEQYGVEINIPYSVMQEDRRIDVSCGLSGKPEFDDPYLLEIAETIKQFQADPDSLDREILECLMTDQVVKGNIPAGDYVLKFDD